MGSDIAGHAGTSTPPAVPSNALTRIADARSWAALGVLTLLAGASVAWWRPFIWLWGTLVVLLFLRAGALVLSARAAGADPEGEPDKPDAKVEPTTPVADP